MIKKLLKTTFVAALLLLASCSPKTEYTHALPKNASMVVALELDDMAQKAGLNGQGGEVVVKKLKSLLKGGLQGEAAQLAERIIDQPSESGLSFLLTSIESAAVVGESVGVAMFPGEQTCS